MNRVLFWVKKKPPENQYYLRPDVQKELHVGKSITVEGSSNHGDLQRGINNFQGVNWTE